MRTHRMTIRGLLIAIAIEGLVLGACINSPWLFIVPIWTAIVFVPQLIVVGVCTFLATREWRTRRRARSLCRSRSGRYTADTGSPEIWYIETGTGAADPQGIVFESNANLPG